MVRFKVLMQYRLWLAGRAYPSGTCVDWFLFLIKNVCTNLRVASFIAIRLLVPDSYLNLWFLQIRHKNHIVSFILWTTSYYKNVSLSILMALDNLCFLRGRVADRHLGTRSTVLCTRLPTPSGATTTRSVSTTRSSIPSSYYGPPGMPTYRMMSLPPALSLSWCTSLCTLAALYLGS